MGRPSKLTPQQWDEVISKHLQGESIAKLADEYKVSRPAMHERIKKRSEKIKDVANQMVSSERAFKALPVTDRIHAVTVRDRLSALMDVYLQTAETAARNSMHLHNLAAEQKECISEGSFEAEDVRERLKSFMALTIAGNAAMVIPGTLIKSSQDIHKEATTEGAPGVVVHGGLPE